MMTLCSHYRWYQFALVCFLVITTIVIVAGCSSDPKPAHNQLPLTPIAGTKQLETIVANKSIQVVGAAQKGKLQTVRSLLEQGADINFQAGPGSTALIEATIKKQEAVVMFLLERGANVDIKDVDGATALFYAPYDSYDTITKALITKSSNVNVRNKSGLHTPLYRAAKKCDYKSMAALLERGAKPNVKNTLGNTPLLMSVRCAHMHTVIKTLLKRGANVNSKNYRGITPLHEATRYGFVEYVRILLGHGADPRMRSKSGETALQIAEKTRRKSIADLLRAAMTSRTS